MPLFLVSGWHSLVGGRCESGHEVRNWRWGEGGEGGGVVPSSRHTFESAGFRVDSCSGEVLRDRCCRPTSLYAKLAEVINCFRSMGDRIKVPRGAVSLALELFMEEGHG